MAKGLMTMGKPVSGGSLDAEEGGECECACDVTQEDGQAVPMEEAHHLVMGHGGGEFSLGWT